MNKTPVIAIFDIGKTNKKIFLFDGQYKIVFEQQVIIPEIKDEDGDDCEDLEKLTGWLRQKLQELLQQSSFEIRAINFCAYGASFVHLDEQDKPLTPLYNYLKKFPEEISAAFYHTYGGPVHFSMLTASPVLGSLNSGMQLYRLKKEQPAVFQHIKYSLHLPQYLAWLVSGKYYSDMTSIGCHTSLWNFAQKNYHEWVYRENILDKLAPIISSDHSDTIILKGKQIQAGVGLHDSSAALIPYLQSFTEPFILISTGTWCINLNPFNKKPLSIAELQEDCLCYLSYRGEPVKASRIFAGYQHEQEVKRISRHFSEADNYYLDLAYEPGIIHMLLEKNNQAPPAHSPGYSIFHSRNLSDYENYEAAYHQLMLDMMADQVHALQLVMEGAETKKIFVDGGFGKNPLYMQMLANSFNGTEVFAASVPQATAIGAAMAIHGSWNQNALPDDLIELKLYKSA